MSEITYKVMKIETCKHGYVITMKCFYCETEKRLEKLEDLMPKNRDMFIAGLEERICDSESEIINLKQWQSGVGNPEAYIVAKDIFDGICERIVKLEIDLRSEIKTRQHLTEYFEKKLNELTFIITRNTL